MMKDRAVKKCPEPFARNSPFGCFAQKVPDTFLPLIAKIVAFIFGFLLAAPLGICGELVLRVDMVGFEDVEDGVNKPESKLLRRIEALVEPDKKFRASCKFGEEAMELHGHAETEADGGLMVTIHYRYVKITPDVAVRNSKFGPQPILSSSSVSSRVQLLPGKPLTIGGSRRSKSSAENQKTFSSSTDMVATLVQLEAE